MGKRTGNERVLAALRKYPLQGVTRLDFSQEPVIDGGEPMLELPARIYDLRQAGHNIVRDGKRDGVAVYKLREGQVSYQEYTGDTVAKPAPVDVVAQWEADAA